MSEKSAAGNRHRRAAVVLLGGLAAGAVLGTSASAAPAASISEQFRVAFTPGAVQSTDRTNGTIVVTVT